MADGDDTAGQGGGVAGAGGEPAPPAADPLSELRATIAAQAQQLEEQGRHVRALNDTLTATLQARQVVPGQGAGRVTPQLRDALRNRGLSDADITHNSEIILPYIEVFAPELVALVEGRVAPIAETVSVNEMVADPETYPYAKALRSEIRSDLAAAKKEGRALSPEAAYHTRVSLDLATGEKSKVRQADTQRRAESNAADLGATGELGHRSSSNVGARAAKGQGPKTAADLSKMSFEERLKFYDTVGDLPVRDMH